MQAAIKPCNLLQTRPKLDVKKETYSNFKNQITDF